MTTGKPDMINELSEDNKPATVKDIRELLKPLQEDIRALQGDMQRVQTSISDLEARVERQGKQLSARTDFPAFPASVLPSTRFKASEVHSCSLPTRVKVGYSG
jgi:hypothetical protein